MKQISYCCFSENKHHSYSDVFGSRELTAYRIGRPDGSPMKMFNVSQSEAESICRNLPAELLDVVKEEYKLVEAATNEDNSNKPLVEIIKEMKDMPAKGLKAICKELDIKSTGKTKEKMIEAICFSLLEGMEE